MELGKRVAETIPAQGARSAKVHRGLRGSGRMRYCINRPRAGARFDVFKAGPCPFMLRHKPNLAKRKARLELESWKITTRGFNRGAANGWKARNNRKISRIAART